MAACKQTDIPIQNVRYVAYLVHAQREFEAVIKVQFNRKRSPTVQQSVSYCMALFKLERKSEGTAAGAFKNGSKCYVLHVQIQD